MKWFWQTSEKEKLQKQYQALMEESFKLSKVDRVKSDEKLAEANALMDIIEKLK